MATAFNSENEPCGARQIFEKNASWLVLVFLRVTAVRVEKCRVEPSAFARVKGHC